MHKRQTIYTDNVEKNRDASTIPNPEDVGRPTADYMWEYTATHALIGRYRHPLMSQFSPPRGGRPARRNHVLNAATRCGQSSTLRVENPRHCCSSSWASGTGKVEMIWRNASSSSWQLVDFWKCIGWTMSRQTFRTGSQLLTSIILTWWKDM